MGLYWDIESIQGTIGGGSLCCCVARCGHIVVKPIKCRTWIPFKGVGTAYAFAHGAVVRLDDDMALLIKTWKCNCDGCSCSPMMWYILSCWPVFRPDPIRYGGVVFRNDAGLCENQSMGSCGGWCGVLGVIGSLYSATRVCWLLEDIPAGFMAVTIRLIGVELCAHWLTGYWGVVNGGRKLCALKCCWESWFSWSWWWFASMCIMWSNGVSYN